MSSLPLEHIILCSILILALISTYKIIRNLLAFIHLVGDKTRLGVLEFMDHVAYNALQEMGEIRKIEQLPVVAFALLFWGMVWAGCLYSFITYILVFMR